VRGDITQQMLVIADAVPEPASAALIAIVALGSIRQRRRR
jgi:hypothetical protein